MTLLIAMTNKLGKQQLLLFTSQMDMPLNEFASRPGYNSSLVVSMLAKHLGVKYQGKL
jgi:hypothetical protein